MLPYCLVFTHRSTQPHREINLASLLRPWPATAIPEGSLCRCVNGCCHGYLPCMTSSSPIFSSLRWALLLWYRRSNLPNLGKGYGIEMTDRYCSAMAHWDFSYRLWLEIPPGFPQLCKIKTRGSFMDNMTHKIWTWTSLLGHLFYDPVQAVSDLSIQFGFIPLTFPPPPPSRFFLWENLLHDHKLRM